MEWCVGNRPFLLLWPFIYTTAAIRLLVIFATLVYSDNFVKIDVYFGQLKSEEVSQNEAYDVISFFSK